MVKTFPTRQSGALFGVDALVYLDNAIVVIDGMTNGGRTLLMERSIAAEGQYRRAYSNFSFRVFLFPR